MRREILVAGTVAGGVGIGLGLIYVLDPVHGRRCRATLRDRTAHVLRSTRVTLGKRAQDLSNRACGLAAEAGAAVRCEAVTDEVLERRVRASLSGVNGPRGGARVGTQVAMRRWRRQTSALTWVPAMKDTRRIRRLGSTALRALARLTCCLVLIACGAGQAHAIT